MKRFIWKFIKIFTILCVIAGIVIMLEHIIFQNKDVEVEKNKEISNNMTTETEQKENTNTVENKVNTQKENTVLENKVNMPEENTNIVEKTNKPKVVQQEKNTKPIENKQSTESKSIQNSNNKKDNNKTTTSKPVETKKEEKYTETEIDIAEKKECNGNNHGIGVGNSGKWFNTKDEAIATYKKEVKIWDDRWTNDEISYEKYCKNCPYGYEIWSCQFCGKWTINYYYDN